MEQPDWDKIKAKEQQQILFSKAIDAELSKYSMESILKYPDKTKKAIVDLYNILKEAHKEVFS